MNSIGKLLTKWRPSFEKGGALERFYPLYEAMDTFFFATSRPATGTVHVRDAADLKRVMITVFVALMPCAVMAMYNTGLQANLAIEAGGIALDSWRTDLISALDAGMSSTSITDCVMHGAVYYLPVLIVTFAVGLGWEVLFAVVRGHEVNEGFFVTGMLFPLILPATIPLWQVALGISFGVVIGKEVFGGTGYNILNPALTARAFLFFGYPAQITGDGVWVPAQTVDVVGGATPLARAAEVGIGGLSADHTWLDAFWGFIPGSMGETSTLACLIGAVILLWTGVASWRIMLSVLVGTIAASSLLNWIGSDTNPQFAIPFWWHFAVGGLAFATVFMATDPVTAPYTRKAQYIYGFLIGILVIVVRVLNPAYPDGLLVAILLMNLFGPLIDHYVVRAHVNKRRARVARDAPYDPHVA
jgi:Na+-transporting NADH:ubiquinone oxidoreductase subunit B